jgi:hypothetical protein
MDMTCTNKAKRVQAQKAGQTIFLLTIKTMGAMLLQYSKVVVMIDINQLIIAKSLSGSTYLRLYTFKPIGSKEDILADMYLKCNFSVFT